MKSMLAPVTLSVLVVTGLCLGHAGWLKAHPPRTAAAAAQADPFSSDAALRHKNCQPSHWRMLVLHRN
jgi:hypothetical protein